VNIKFIDSVYVYTFRWFFTSAKEVVFVVLCLSICLLATSHKNFHMDLHEIFREGW